MLVAAFAQWGPTSALTTTSKRWQGHLGIGRIAP